ncbi:SANT SWI3, ADA2, N-coR and TFIIIB'' DNA-binding domain-containing protein [Thermochaetoides thermophila DSM 1495]|uniref:SANT SWI3, ADA2, N-coR and TFIIIB'' DNA-binding domain-containing protein n=1 Tax=Chaetomium thermophilum (strain DSM 1495 / CBS 144.50 / IMI 039719) TaxID=759272 RepID=G0S2S1_CHATD|nr:SANT SWI3, ADA2, N-coR and TFIIIB'' DNA-binding domain-containing protein [Thermochaetoides thermophila DSM 1495]EGS22304.1 SANT SWI3, ADA2, N-coR and TFIIIB'' DNA-binding domain-containing protein [Thermochaetoides thermophila DSM 1495]
MPDLTRTPSHQQYQQQPVPASLPSSISTMAYYQNTRPLSDSFYVAPTGGLPMTYDPYAVNAVPPLQIPTSMGGPVGGPVPPVQHRASSGAWNPEEDAKLLQLRAMGKNWNQIQREAFPNKTGNACRKRHERLMERRGQNDFDARRFERVCKEYMSMRKEIWQPLASRCGEKWQVVEHQLMSNGLKNIFSGARAYSRRGRNEANGQPLPPGASFYGDDDDPTGAGALDVMTPIDDMDVPDDHGDAATPYSSSPDAGPHSTPGAASTASSSASAYAAAAYQQGHHGQGGYGGYAPPPPPLHSSAAAGGYGHHASGTTQHHGAHHGYSSSVSSTGSNTVTESHHRGHHGHHYSHSHGGAVGGSGSGNGNGSHSSLGMGIASIMNHNHGQGTA